MGRFGVRPGTRTAMLVAVAVAVLSGAGALVSADRALATVAGLSSVVVAVLALRVSAPVPGRDHGTGAHPQAPVPRHAPAAAPEPVPEPSSSVRPSPVPEVGPAVDPDGLFDLAFLEVTLRGRVAVARRALRPLSVVCFEVLELGMLGDKRPVEHGAVAAVVGRTLREADVAGCLGDGTYAFVLEDTAEDGAVWTAERLRRNLAEEDPGRRFRAGVASYPNHGLEANELSARAQAALVAARDWSRDRIEVATLT